MKYQLTALEARVIGCLLEKQVTTPEQYPLSVNGVVTVSYTHLDVYKRQVLSWPGRVSIIKSSSGELS